MITRGVAVLVHEPRITPWRGVVHAIKPPRAFSRKDGKPLKQRADVRREDGNELAIPLEYLELVEAS